MSNKFNSMEAMLNNPGLQQITEKILFNLNYDNLKVCEFINQSTKKNIEQSIFLAKETDPKRSITEEPRRLDKCHSIDKRHRLGKICSFIFEKEFKE